MFSQIWIVSVDGSAREGPRPPFFQQLRQGWVDVGDTSYRWWSCQGERSMWCLPIYGASLGLPLCV